MRILMHICCGPCAVYPIDALREQGCVIHGYFFNPNIHPYQEYQRRRESLELLAAKVNLPVIYDDRYDLEGFLRDTVFRETERCRFCHLRRLQAAAGVAARGGFDALTTTLLYSKYQKHDLVVQAGREAAARVGIDFFYQDFREGWTQGVERSTDMGLYRQQYCGCIYSEKERFYRPPEKKARRVKSS
ncbi:MAG: epoxyqueuosine reductase QueH [Pseudomonadota bacterium]